ncbi:DUF488 family protein, N3 subclade [Aquitalea pelogenes]|uniref:DUF488 family protein, N3 subclade n=1 Tax=Aquitalea pelogenes TaxID=1293573 RepID=UPI0035B40B2A
MHITLQSLQSYQPDSTPAFLIGSEPPAGLPADVVRRLRHVPALSPAPGLSDWMHWREERWSQFCEIYWAVLRNNPQRWEWLAHMARRQHIILLHAEADATLSAARALQLFLQQQEEMPLAYASPVCFAAQFGSGGLL